MVEIDKLTGEETLTSLPNSMKQLAPDTWDEAELIIKPRSLMYGVYKLSFYSRVWDTNVEDPLFTRILPFVKASKKNYSMQFMLIKQIKYTYILLQRIKNLLNFVGYLQLHRNCTFSSYCEYGRRYG